VLHVHDDQRGGPRVSESAFGSGIFTSIITVLGHGSLIAR
jgi:hypothetical protein